MSYAIKSSTQIKNTMKFMKIRRTKMKVFSKALEMGAKVATKVKANSPTELLVVGTALTVGTDRKSVV